MKKLGYAGLSTVLCLAFALPGLGQQPSAAELACNEKYGKFYNEQSSVPLFDAFENDATCKDSMYREGAYSLLAQKLAMGQKWKDLLALVPRFAKDFPNSKTPYVYQQGLVAASSLGDGDQMIAMGEKVLTVKPDDLNSILIIATTIPVTTLPTDPAAKDKLLNRALELAKQLVAMTRPMGVEEKAWQLQVVGPAHGVIGFVYLQRALYPEAEAEFDQATKINPKDQMSWYRYGTAAVKIVIVAQGLIAPAYADCNDNFRTLGPERDACVAKRDAIDKDFADKRDKAIDLLISAVALPNPNITTVANGTLESLWKPAHNNTLEGLPEEIAKRKAELNK